MANIAQTVTELIADAVQAQGVSLWDVRFVKEGADYFLRVFIDKEGGVGIDDCVNVSHAIDPILDEADPIDRSYCLEVCSPGINRELTRPEHFAAFIGKPVTVRLYRAVESAKEITGQLLSYDGTLILADGEKTYCLTKEDIASVKAADSIAGGTKENG